MNDRLPELLWAALLLTVLPRAEALSIFRQIASFIHSLPEADRFDDVTHSGLAALTEVKLRGFVKILGSTQPSLVALTPLRLFESLPAHEAWNEFLEAAPIQLGWDTLSSAVARTLYHQSEAATDCRWLRVLTFVVAGKLHLRSGMTATADEILNYPDFGDLRKVRPFIRATEGAVSSAIAGTQTGWARSFWDQCMRNTPCFPLRSRIEEASLEPGTNAERLSAVQSALVQHARRTQVTTDVNARHDTVFGTGLYSLYILQEILQIGNSVSIMSRMALRTLVECYVTLAYLLLKDSPELWKSFRSFGAGQAKLSFLKLYSTVERPSSVNVETLKDLANEDAWQEFVPIELGNWEKSDLRKMSEEAGVKEVYDRFYGWTSAYSHAQWCAIRDVVFDTCGNPLHRLHRIPREEARSLPDVVNDACWVVDRILDLLSKAYPDFSLRTLMVATP